MALTNAAACAVFVGNCWWESLLVCYLACVVPIGLQAYRAARHSDGLRNAVVFGAIVALLWPLGEGVVVKTFGWWGDYTAPGPMIWETPVYCMLIGWLASTHVYYWSHRIIDIGYSVTTSVLCCGLTAMGLGVLGENLFVGARMWVYVPSEFDWWGVPAFVPIAYGVGYGIIPLLRRMRLVSGSLVFLSVLLVVCVGLGLAVGFFPR